MNDGLVRTAESQGESTPRVVRYDTPDDVGRVERFADDRASILNGHAAVGAHPPAAPSGPRMPHRERWLDLPDEYGEAGMKILVWVNYPARLQDEILKGGEERAFAALGEIVRAHNGWLGEDGEPLPPANTKDFWLAISNELGATIYELLRLKGEELPSSLARPKKS